MVAFHNAYTELCTTTGYFQMRSAEKQEKYEQSRIAYRATQEEHSYDA